MEGAQLSEACPDISGYKLYPKTIPKNVRHKVALNVHFPKVIDQVHVIVSGQMLPA